jgi:hypothetical protein
MVAPSFVSGAFVVVAHLAAPVVQFFSFAPEMRHLLAPDEPLATLAFGLAGLFILVLRFRSFVLQSEYHEALVEAATNKVLADKYLYIRDLMNAPLQVLTTSLSLLEQNPGNRELIIRCERAVERLSQLNQLLRKHEREEAKLSFDAESSLRT